MRRVITEPKKGLSVWQQYLLQRLPSLYKMNDERKVIKPKEVIYAEKVVDRWNKAKAHRTCATKKRNEALLRKAREAVYFAAEEKALAIIRQCEKMLKTCKD